MFVCACLEYIGGLEAEEGCEPKPGRSPHRTHQAQNIKASDRGESWDEGAPCNAYIFCHSGGKPGRGNGDK